jgi:hypothetical protein
MKVMTPEFDSRIADWLEDDPEKAPSIVLETVVGALPSMPQRRSWRSLLRSPQMQRFAITAVVVAVAALGIGGWWMGRTGTVGTTPAPTAPPATTAPTPTTQPTPAATMRVLSGLDQGSDLLAGTYRIGSPFSVPFTITVEGDWRLGRLESNVVWMGGPQTSIDVERPEKVYADACVPDSATTVGSSVDEVTSAMTSIAGFIAGPVTDVVVDGATGKTFTLDNSIQEEACPEGPRLLTIDRFGSDEPATGSYSDHDRIWVLDVNGELVVIDVRTYDNPTAAQQTAAEEIVDSIDFD